MTSFYYYDQNPSGFCFLVQIRAFAIPTSLGLQNLNMKGKNEKDFGRSSKMTPSCKWLIGTQKKKPSQTLFSWLLSVRRPHITLFSLFTSIFFAVLAYPISIFWTWENKAIELTTNPTISSELKKKVLFRNFPENNYESNKKQNKIRFPSFLLTYCGNTRGYDHVVIRRGGKDNSACPICIM